MLQIDGTTYYSTSDLATDAGVSRQTVSRFVRKTRPGREWRSWTRFDEKEYAEAQALFARMKELYPSHPLRALSKVQQVN